MMNTLLKSSLGALTILTALTGIATPALAGDRDGDGYRDYRSYEARDNWGDHGRGRGHGHRGRDYDRGYYDRGYYAAVPYYQPPRVIYAPPAVYYPAPVYRSGVEVILRQGF
ncbi:MAG: hypothetical protein ABL868_00555 [Sulfuriferula sp.]